MITEASFYLFNATQRRVYLGSIKILIPKAWKAKEYEKAKQELYVKADVIVAPPYWKHGNDPYTLQYAGCGEKGKYIHFTPEFLINDDLVDIYGSYGRLFVHEWSHLQWGVFDEYDNEKPFYISEQNQVKATRCSSDLTGMYVCEKQSCTEGSCVIDKVTGLLKEGCAFIHDKDQNASSSIMYMQSLSSEFEFCNASNHNTEAPNFQNKMCSYKSTWDVIMSSEDFKMIPPLTSNGLPVSPTFTLLQAKDRVICLVLDISSNMNKNNRLRQLHLAAEIYLLQIVEENSYVGIITFSHVGEVKSSIRQITSDDVRNQLVSVLPVMTFGEWPNVCAGLQMGLEAIKNHDGNAPGSEIILLSSGEDGNLTKCSSDVVNNGLIVHTIALGPSTSKELEQLGSITGGLSFFATDRPDSNSLTDVFAAIVAGHGDANHQPVQIESATERVNGYAQIKRTVTVDSTVGKDTFFVVTWLVNEPNLTLCDPEGRSYTIEDFDIDPFLHTARLWIPGIAQVGDWMFALTNIHMSPDILSVIVTSRAVKPDVSAITVQVHTNRDSVAHPDSITVYAQVNQGFSPILDANVSAIIEPESGDQMILDLFDNGAGADVLKNDGVYSRYLFSFVENGHYGLKVRVWRDNKTVSPHHAKLWSHAMYIPGYIKNGTIQMNAPRVSMNSDVTHSRSGSFSRIAYGGSFTVSAVPSGSYSDMFPPCKITDLEARAQDNEVFVTWTAPGDDFDQGQAASYEIRTSVSLLELRDNFENSASMNTSGLKPQQAGCKEIFVFKPETSTVANTTIIYVAVRAIDKVFLHSAVSNIAQVVLFHRGKDTLITHAKYSILTIVLLACGLLLLAVSCLVISTAVWMVKKKKKMAIGEAIL
ncbi:calcium-activated chloride channel regulator 2-like isoform X2 [Paroedura picta]